MSVIAPWSGRYSRLKSFVPAIRGGLALVMLAFGSAYAESLTFNEALRLAEQQSPDLIAEAANLGSRRSAAAAAGSLPDPQVILGLENVPASGVDQWSLDRDFMTMQKLGVMQEFPNRKKRQAQVDAAQATIRQAEAEQRIQRLAVRSGVATAWLKRFYLEQRVALFERLNQENQLWARTVQAQLAGGRGVAADSLIPSEEAADLADRRDELNAQLLKATSTLRRYVGPAADESLAGQPSLLAFDADHLRAHVHQHPELTAFSPMLEVAQAEAREAEAAKRPDWSMEVAYGRRGSEFGDMVSAQVTVGLPLFGRSRQDPQIATKHQEIARLSAQRDSMLREHIEQLESELADDAALRQQLLRLRETRLPLGRQKVELQMVSYRSGRADLSAVLSARRELIELQLKEIELQEQRDAIAAKLYFAYGEGAL